jgi:preprotein translocase subunit Sec63
VDGVHDYIPEQVGRSIYDFLKILGLGLGASKHKVKLAYKRLVNLYHLNKCEKA